MKLRSLIFLSLALVLMLTVPIAFGQSPAPPTSSATGSKKPVTRATPEIQKIIDACAATADDLKVTRGYVTVLESENKLLYERLETEKKTTAILTELNETRRAENAALRDTVTAKNETIVAKDAVIANQDKLVATLKKNKSSAWQRVADVLLGVGLFALLK